MTLSVRVAIMKPLAVITGGTRGIGLALARKLKPTHDLLILGRDEERLAQIGQELGARTLAVDLTDLDATEKAVAALNLQRVDLLAHCAGVLHTGKLEVTTNAEFVEGFTVNVIAIATITRVLTPALLAGRARVIMINSGAGKHGSPTSAVYAPTKFALNGLSESLRLDLGPQGVQISTIAPGRTDTDMQRQLVASEGATYNPDAYLSAEEVAGAAMHVITQGGDIDYLSIRPPVAR